MILSPTERIAAYTARGWWGNDTVDDLLRRSVAAQPHRLAAVDAPNRATVTDGAPRRLSYAELDGLVDAVAAQMLDRGLRHGDIVLLQMPNVTEAVATLLACARLGVVASPVAVQYREHELEQIIATLEPRAAITVGRVGSFRTAQMHAAIAARTGMPVLAWGDDLPAAVVSMNAVAASPAATARVAECLAHARPSANDILTICWTSGTEARPKGVPRSHNHWLAIGRIAAYAATLGDGDVMLGPFPLINMSAIGAVAMPWLLHRGTLVLHHPFDLPTFMAQVQGERVNYMLAPPPVLNMLLKQKELLARFDIRSLRSVCSGSAPLAAWMVQGWQDEHGIRIVNMYGSNEGAALASGATDVPDARERASYFPRWGVDGIAWDAAAPICFETRLADPASGEPITEPGLPGELCVRGATVFDGYFREPDMTRRAFDNEGFFRTGDLFTIEGAGPAPRFYRFVGRCKEIIIRGGQNISPAEIETLLEGHPLIAEVACIGVPDEAMGERVCAVVALRPNASVSLEDLAAFLNEKNVAAYKRPEMLRIVAALPRNPVGKVVRRELRSALVEEQGKPRA